MFLRRRTSAEQLAHSISLGLMPAQALTPTQETQRQDYRFRAHEYIRDVLGYTLWRGTPQHPGQAEVVDAYELALRQQYERLLLERGEITAQECTVYREGMVIQNHLHLSGGHGFGKTLLMALLCRHFYDNFLPSVTYCFAPTLNQLRNLLWKEIETITKGAPLEYGKLYADGAIKDVASHFVESIAVPQGDATEKIQGQHAAYQLYVVDESEGVGAPFWNSRESLIAGGISIVLMSGNPKTRISQFYSILSDPRVISFTLDCIYHPNVIENREIVPSAVRRDYVEAQLRKMADIVTAHDSDSFTFSVPWRPSVIYKPHNEFLWRVRGIAPADSTDKNFVSVGRFQAACNRAPVSTTPEFASIGVDCAWDGLDKGTVYVRHNGACWLEAELTKQNPSAYYFAVKDALLKINKAGAVSVQVRVDAGGGYGSGMIELLEKDAELIALFAQLKVHRVHFGATGSAVHDKEKYYDVITELTADVAESLLGVSVINPHATLQHDLCLRQYEPRNVHGRFVKKLQNKGEFKNKHGRSPDHGDGFVLAMASEFLFKSDEWSFS